MCNISKKIAHFFEIVHIFFWNIACFFLSRGRGLRLNNLWTKYTCTSNAKYENYHQFVKFIFNSSCHTYISFSNSRHKKTSKRPHLPLIPNCEKCIFSTFRSEMKANYIIVAFSIFVQRWLHDAFGRRIRSGVRRCLR